MEIEKVLKLIEAGFSADDIRKMLQPEPAADPQPVSAADPQPAPAADLQPAPAADPQPAPAGDPNARVLETMNNMFEKFEQKLNAIAKLSIAPSIDGITPKTIDDVIDHFFEGGI